MEVERPSRKVRIYSIELLDEREVFSGETISFHFRVSCSKGTYIRTMAVMMGELLGYPAHMSTLKRIRSASFTIEDCLTFEEIEQLMEQGLISHALRPLETALSHLPKYIISDKVAEKVKNGSLLSIPDSLKNEEGPIIAESEDGQALAIYAKHPSKPDLLKPVKVLRNDQE